MENDKTEYPTTPTGERLTGRSPVFFISHLPCIGGSVMYHEGTDRDKHQTGKNAAVTRGILYKKRKGELL